MNDIAVLLPPGKTQDFAVTWEKPLPKGEYRIIKPIWDGEQTSRYAINFNVL